MTGAGVAPRPAMGLIVRMFTATSGRPDEARPEHAGPAWMSPIATRAEFEERLDIATEIGATGIEVTQAGQPSGVRHLLESPRSRAMFTDAFAGRGLEIAALNCAGMPLHPVRGPEHRRLIEDTFRLAELLGVEKIVTMSGTTGDGAAATTVNWIFYPWPDDSVALLERQWEAGIALWTDLAELAERHGVRRIAFELHPIHLVYNVPTLVRMREAVGPVIGANVDPSHLFWQQMDPVRVVEALGEAVHHVQLKDTETVPDEVALAGVLDQRPFEDPSARAWRYRTIGRGHDAAFWGALVDALAAVGYDGYVSIENEDPYQSYEEGVREAAGFLAPLLAGTAGA